MDFNDVLVLLPCLNESISLKKTITSISSELPGCTIIVIDNGSTDGSQLIAKESKAILINEPRRGKGYAFKAALKMINTEYKAVFMVDADDTYGLENLRKSIDAVKNLGYDMVVGQRTIVTSPDTQRPGAYRIGHKLGNKVFTVIGEAFHPAGINDTLSGYRVFSPSFLHSFTGGNSGFELEAELNAHAYLMGSAVLNLDVSYRGRNFGSESKLSTYKDGLRILRMSFRIFRNNRPQIAFSMLSIPWLIVSILSTYRALAGYFETGLVSQFPSLIVGVGTFVVFSLLIAAGIILERVKQVRFTIAQIAYRAKH
jgi:glycosyltransferase involved in cell wall biosynthesis